MDANKIIADAYDRYHAEVLRYISYKLECAEDAQDLAQDVFLKLLEYDTELMPATMRYLVFTIARNLVNDYLRHRYIKHEVDRYIMDYTPQSDTVTENSVLANELAELEQRRIATMPHRRSNIYVMRRFEGLSAKEIAARLDLSTRTVENHLFIGFGEMRRFIRACI